MAVLLFAIRTSFLGQGGKVETSVVTCSNKEGEMKTGLDKGAQTLPHPKAVHLVPLSTP